MKKIIAISSALCILLCSCDLETSTTAETTTAEVQATLSETTVGKTAETEQTETETAEEQAEYTPDELATIQMEQGLTAFKDYTITGTLMLIDSDTNTLGFYTNVPRNDGIKLNIYVEFNVSNANDKIKEIEADEQEHTAILKGEFSKFVDGTIYMIGEAVMIDETEV